MGMVVLIDVDCRLSIVIYYLFHRLDTLGCLKSKFAAQHSISCTFHTFALTRVDTAVLFFD